MMSETILISESFTNVYINNIDPCITSNDLREICEKYGGRVISAIIIKERGVSLGYGFCNFASHNEAVRAVECMNNLFVMGKRLAVSRAASKADRAKFLRSVHSPSGRPEENANVYVKNLDYSIDEEMLRSHFRPFGPIINVRIMRDDIGNSKGYGFVSYARHADAVEAVRALDGKRVGKLPIHADFYEPKKSKKYLAATAAPSTRGSMSVPASPHETFSKTKYSASTIVTPTQSKFPSPLVIPCKMEEGSFYCGTPLSHDEVNDIDENEEDDEEEYVSEEEDDEKEGDGDSDESEEYGDSDDYDSEFDNNENVSEEEEEGELQTSKTPILLNERKRIENGYGGNSTKFQPATQQIKNLNVLVDRKKTMATTATASSIASLTLPTLRLPSMPESTSRQDSTIPKISQLIAKPRTPIYKENEIKVTGLRYLCDEKDIFRLFYDLDCTGARPVLNSRGVRTGDWYVVFASKRSTERALAMCNGECFVIRGCRVRAERVPFAERAAPAIPHVRFVGMSSAPNSLGKNNCCCWGEDSSASIMGHRRESYEFSSLLNDVSLFSDFY